MRRKNQCQKRYGSFLFIAIVAVYVMFMGSTGCSQNGEQQVEEKGKIVKMTDKAAEKAVKKIRTPMDKAKATQGLGNDRLEEIDKAMQQQ